MARDIELLNSPENILYSADDFPIIEETSLHDYLRIDWSPHRRTELANRLGEGISITAENMSSFEEEFGQIKKRFGYPDARLDWSHITDSGDQFISWYSIQRIVPFPGEVEMWNWVDIYNNPKNNANIQLGSKLKPRNKIIAHNIEKPEMAIFYIESLAHYLRYAGISFPYISTQSNYKGDLFYSFEIPFTPESQERYEFACLTEPRLFDNLSVYTKQGKDKYTYVWVANDLPDPLVAIKLFNSLSKPLRQGNIV